MVVRKRILSIVVTLLMAFAMMPVATGTAQANVSSGDLKIAIYGETTGELTTIEYDAEKHSMPYSITYKVNGEPYGGRVDAFFELNEKDGDEDLWHTNVGTYTAILKEEDFIAFVATSSNYSFQGIEIVEPASKLTITPAPLTITAKEQTYTYNGETQGEGDTVYADPEQISKKITAKGLKGDDYVKSIIVDGQGKELGEYKDAITVSNAVIYNKDGDDVTGNYNIAYEPGTLTIEAPAPDPKPEPAPAKISGTLLAKMTAKGDRGLALTWNKVRGAEGYDVFFSRCNHNGKETTCKKVKTFKGNKTFKWTKSSLKKGIAYKAYVKAWVKKDGKKTYVKTSPTVHAYTSGGNNYYTSSKSVTVKKASVLLKAGKTYKIKAGVTKLNEGKMLMPSWHAPKLRYISSNKKIATVSKGGKITAKGKGKCKVYVIAANGARKTVKVTVE